MYKLKLFLLPLALLLAFMAFACAPPDDDDRSSGPSGPAITSASYDVGTALLTVQGTNLSPTEAQIQTITVDGLALSSYTADDPATGPDSRGLTKGKYRIANDGTALWLKLTDKHKATLNGKPGMDSDGLKKGLLTSTGTWAGLNTAKDLTVRNIPDKQSPKLPEAEQTEEVEDKQSNTETEEQSPKLPEAEQTEEVEDKQSNTETEEQSPELPEAEQTEQVEDKQSKTETEEQSPEAAITGATYHVGTALLTLQGSNLASAQQAQIQTITVDGLALSSYTADATATGEDSRSLAKGKYRIKRDGTAIWLRLTDQHKATLNGKDGMDSNGLKKGLLTSTGTWAGLNTAKALGVSGHPPAITRATYNAITGVLVITGTNLPKALLVYDRDYRKVDSWDFTKLTLVSGDGTNRFTLPQRGSYSPTNFVGGSKASATSLTITFRGSQKTKAEKILVKDGKSDDAGAYNLEAAAGFAGGSAADTTNPITVSGYTASITSAIYDAITGLLYISGSILPKTVADWDFTKLTLVSGDGSNRFTLPQHATAGENTATGSKASAISLNITLSGSVKAKANKILVQDGDSDNAGAYNLEAAAGFADGSAEDTSNPITVSGYASQINNVYYYRNSGQLRIFGSGLPTAVADWDFSKLTLVSGNGSKKYTLPRHATAGENTATGSNANTAYLIITLSGSVKAKANKILVQAGVRDGNGAYNLEAAAGFGIGSTADPTNAIQVLNFGK